MQSVGADDEVEPTLSAVVEGHVAIPKIGDGPPEQVLDIDAVRGGAEGVAEVVSHDLDVVAGDDREDRSEVDLDWSVGADLVRGDRVHPGGVCPDGVDDTHALHDLHRWTE